MNLEHLLIIIKLVLFHNMIIMIYFYIHIKEKKNWKFNTYFLGKKVKNRINYPFYIVDFAYINGKIIFIILSPFFPTTVECLFNWNSDINKLNYWRRKIEN